jgi:endonuclease-3
MTKKIKSVKTQNIASQTTSQQKIDIIFKELKKMYPAPETELIFHTPFQLLMAVMLSAQTTDKTVNKVTDAIRQSIKSPQDLLQHSQSRIESKIKSVNYFRAKANHLRQTANLLVENRPSNIKKKD